MAMPGNPNDKTDALEEELGYLAMRFRGARTDKDRNEVAEEYEQAIKRLIETQMWQDVPAPEDLLPADRMPQAFFDYWSQQG